MKRKKKKTTEKIKEAASFREINERCLNKM